MIIEDANAPPPTPVSNAQAIRELNLQLLSDKTTPVVIARHSKMEVVYTTFLPPDTCVKKECDIRRVAPDNPATPGSRYSKAS